MSFVIYILLLHSSFFCTVLQPEMVIDMKQRFVGHCNVGTDIKQASFLGQRGMLFSVFDISLLYFVFLTVILVKRCQVWYKVQLFDTWPSLVDKKLNLVLV